MLKYIFVIALVLHVYVCAENKTSEASTLKLKCINGTFKIAKYYYDLYNETLTSYIQEKDSKSLEDLKDDFKSFTTTLNNTCVGGKLPRNENMTFFIDVIQFAVKDDKYSKFINSNGSLCVEAMKDDLEKCILDNLGTPGKAATNDASASPQSENSQPTGAHGQHGPTSNAGTAGSQTAIDPAFGSAGTAGSNPASIAGNDKRYYYGLFQSLLKMAYLNLNELNCDKTRDMQICVKAVMKKHNTTCTTGHSEFVDSVFAFSLTKCPKEAVKKNGANSFLFSPVIILLPLVGTMLM